MKQFLILFSASYISKTYESSYLWSSQLVIIYVYKCRLQKLPTELHTYCEYYNGMMNSYMYSIVGWGIVCDWM